MFKKYKKIQGFLSIEMYYPPVIKHGLLDNSAFTAGTGGRVAHHTGGFLQAELAPGQISKMI